MDMKVKNSLIKAAREQRAWSQSHLAETCGLSLRTIQRIEKSGQASPESIKALASVLECSTNELMEPGSDNFPVAKQTFKNRYVNR